MRHAQLTEGRRFAIALDDGEDFFPTLTDFCAEQGIRQAWIPNFIGGFREVRLVGACGPLSDPEAPVWDAVTATYVEALGGGTLAWDEEQERLAPHIHLAVGLKADQALGRTSHLLGGVVQFINELLLIEVLSPQMLRPRPGRHAVPTLTFASTVRT